MIVSIGRRWGQKSDWSFIDVWRRSSSLPWRCCMAATPRGWRLAVRGVVCLGVQDGARAPALDSTIASNLLGVLFVLVQPRIMKYTVTTEKDLRRAAEQDRLTLRRLARRRSAHLARPGGAARRAGARGLAPSGCSQVCCCEAGRCTLSLQVSFQSL